MDPKEEALKESYIVDCTLYARAGSRPIYEEADDGTFAIHLFKYVLVPVEQIPDLIQDYRDGKIPYA